MTDVPSKFTGYAAQNAEDGKAFKVAPWEYDPPTWNERCVDIKISACGVCGSCIHTITNGWGGTKYPCVVGHEIVGKVVRAGKESGHKVGARVGFGAQAGSCEDCEMCNSNQENMCMKGMIGTYQGGWDGDYTKGGYADYFRGYGRFAIPIPEGLSDESVAPMLCGGVTVWTPLTENNAGPGKKVAIVGIGGLGHFGLLWSAALGADTYALSHSHSKEDDVEKMGVAKDHFIATGDGIEEAAKKYKDFFDLIIVTNNQNNPPLEELYLPIAARRSKIVFVGLSEEKLPRFKPSMLALKTCSIGGSIIGSPKQIEEMLQFALKHKINSFTQSAPMSDTGKTLQAMDDGKARYRFVLKN